MLSSPSLTSQSKSEIAGFSEHCLLWVLHIKKSVLICLLDLMLWLSNAIIFFKTRQYVICPGNHRIRTISLEFYSIKVNRPLTWWRTMIMPPPHPSYLFGYMFLWGGLALPGALLWGLQPGALFFIIHVLLILTGKHNWHTDTLNLVWWLYTVVIQTTGTDNITGQRSVAAAGRKKVGLKW